ncbi:MAG: polysaccharide pyruvyl transferase family protein [Desulfobacteraceae bacterium]
MLRILIECGHERNRNAGDEAYFASMVHLFRNYFEDVNISAFSDRPSRDRSRYGIKTIYSGGTLYGTLFSSLDILKGIRACDVYVWGGGQLLRDDTGIKSPLYRLSRPFIAKLLGKPLMAYAVGVGPLEMGKTRFFARKILNLFDLITVRDSKSLELLKHIGVSKPDILLTVDPAFGLEISPDEIVEKALKQLPLDRNTPIVGVAPFGPAFRWVRSLLPAKYQVKFDMWSPGGKSKYQNHVRNMALICDHVVKQYDVALIFIAQDISWQGCDDEISRAIISHMSRSEKAVLINADDYRPETLKGIIGRMAFMIGGRMHSLILACSVGTPVLGICFEDKIRQLGGILGQKECFIDAKEIGNFAEMHFLISKMLNERQYISSELINLIGKLSIEVQKNVHRLDRLVSNYERQDPKRKAVYSASRSTC